LGTSASVSGTPKVALPVSMVKLTLPASGFGSKLICASQLRNLPSTGTPIWCEVKPISLWAGTTFCCEGRRGGQQRGQQGRRDEGTGHGRTPVGDVWGRGRVFALSRGRDAWVEQAVLVDEWCLSAAPMCHHQQRHRPGQGFVPGLDQLGQLGVLVHEAGQGSTPNSTMGKPAAEL
jgi:hypothetical protein